MKYTVEVENLTKYYGNLLAVDHISFKVKEGEIFGFLGPNGAGKTTTTRMLTGVIKPNDGSAKIMDYDVQKESIRAKQVMGIVPEMSNAYVDLSAWNNLMLIGKLYGISKTEREEHAERLLKAFGLWERRNDLVKGYSKGMKQKLIICMALMNDPKVLILDEPTSGLDVESSRFIRNRIQELNKTGITVFFSTHNMEEANQLCERVAVINHGKIVAIEAPDTLRLRIGGLRTIEVVFDRQINPEHLKVSKAIELQKIGDKVRLYVGNLNDVNDVVFQIVEYARLNNLKILSLNTLVPTLEDVFIKLVQKGG